MNKVYFLPRLVACIILLLVLIVLHVIPLPILEGLMLFIMIYRPRWFKNLVDPARISGDAKNCRAADPRRVNAPAARLRPAADERDLRFRAAAPRSNPAAP